MRHRSKGERGLALIGVVGMLLVFLVFAGAMVTQLASETNSVKTAAISNRALNAADAGVHATVEQIQAALALNQSLPSGAITYNYPEAGGGPSTTRYSATIDKVTQANGLNYYQITSTGTYDNGFVHASRVARAIARAVPLADFASFSNYETNQFGNQVWYLSTQYFNGPVYSGGPMHIAYATPGPSPAPTPIFGNSVQTVNDPVWAPNDPGNNNADWANIMTLGASAFTLNKTPLALPQPDKNVYVASEAWQGDGTNTFPGGFPPVNPGVYIDGAMSEGLDAATTTQTTDTTGIFINAAGGTATITSTVSGNTDTMTINGPGFGGPYTVTINYTSFSSTGDCSGSVTVKHGANQHTFAGTPCGAAGPGVSNPGNGAIFTYGGITFGNGTTPNTTTEGSFAFVTPDYQGVPHNNITIMGNMAYDAVSAQYDKTELWANDVILHTLASNVLIDGSIIAGYPGEAATAGNFNNFYCKRTSCGTSNQGTLTIFGSLVENARGAVGEVIQGNQFGFSRVIQFDQRFATAPPPFAPTTGELEIIAEEDLGS